MFLPDLFPPLLYSPPLHFQFHFIIIQMQTQQLRGSQNLLQYITAENKQLKEEISDLKELVQMNKLEIDVLSKNNASNKYIQVISNYRLASDNYQKKLELLQQKIQSLNSQKLVLQQLNQEANQELKATQQLHRDRIESLQVIIQDLEKKVLHLQKYERNYDTLTGFVERNKQIFTPTEQAKKFLQREEDLKEEAHLLKLECKRGKQNQQNLLKVNGILRHKVVTLQAKLAMPNKNLGQILDKSLKRLMMYFIETQKRILTGQESDSQGEEDLQLIAPELSTYFGQQNARRQKNYNVPHLDLLKIRGSIANGNMKIKEQLVKRNHLSKQERIERLQIQLQYTRRQLTKNIIDLRQQTQRRKALQSICNQLQARNDIVTQAYQKSAQKLSKYLRKTKQSKQKQLKFIELDQTLNDITTTVIKHDNNIMDYQKLKPTDTHSKMPSPTINISETPQQYKIHLQLLHRDLARNQKLQHLSKLKQKQAEEVDQKAPKLIRSTSNPLLYFNERRQNIMEVGETLPNKESKRMMQHTAIMGRIGMGHGEELLDQIEI